jgi:hypothetical protein
LPLNEELALVDAVMDPVKKCIAIALERRYLTVSLAILAAHVLSVWIGVGFLSMLYELGHHRGHCEKVLTVLPPLQKQGH